MRREEREKHEIICPQLHWQFVSEAETGARFKKKKLVPHAGDEPDAFVTSKCIFSPVIHTAAGSAQ